MKSSGGKMKKVYHLKKRNFLIASLLFLGVFMITLGGFIGNKSLMSSLRSFFDDNQKLGEKSITPNKIGEQFDGTYKLSLTVTGDASTDKTVSSANVLVVFDTSNSMSDYRSYIHMAYDTGRYGLVNGQYINLYSAQNRNSQLNNDTFAGTVYVRNGNSYTVYTGQRYVQTRRADAGEKVIYDFTQDLFSYQDKENNPENIQMALISFNHTAHEIQDWTSNEDDITGKLSSTGLNGTKQIENSSGTNYEVALQSAINDYLSTADGDPTFVIFFTDGAPTQVEGTANGVYDAPEDCYGPAKDEALTIQRYDTSKHEADANSSNTTLYGIYAYGNEADYLDDIIYYAHNNGVSRDNERPETDPTDYYYNASDTAALTAAVKDIFSDIVDTLGISNVSIKDGTTTNVQTSQGISHLLTIDENSYEYWLSIPITNNEMKRVDVASGEEYTITLRDNGDGTFKASSSKWADVTITGKIENGVFKYKWTESNNFYKFNPPSASFNSSTGYVDWNLASVGTLLDGVTYEVTFDVYPSQETYDLIADLKNDKIDYDTEVDPAIKQYLHKNGDSYSLDTNTVDEDGNSTATITYTDTRTDEGEQTYTYTNPQPVATDASSISIKKTWDNQIGDGRKERPVSVNLQRDGENFYPAELNAANDFELNDIAIAVGLARLDGDTLTVLDTGHDYKFAELGSESYNWELQTETVHPMLINGVIKKLILVEDESTIPSAMGDKKYYDGYYKLGNKYYKDEGTNPTIHAINHRRSNLNVKKLVDGENANPNDTFEFTIRVTQNGEDGQALADDTTTNNDDIWFSICDTTIDSTCKDPNSLVKDESLVTGAQKEMRDGSWTGYYYVTNTTEVKVKLKDKYNLRFTNLVSNTDFSVVEGNTTNYEFEKIETTSGFDSNKDSKSISGKTITGHIGQSNKVYQIEYTNKNNHPETVDAKVKKVWDDNNDQDGKRPETLTVTLSDGKTATLSESNNWEATITGLPKWKNGEEVEYTWTEETLPAGYEMTSNKTEGTITTITNSHTPEVIDVDATKVWKDNENQDGIRPGQVTFKLTNTGETITLDGNKDIVEDGQSGELAAWVATFKNLPKYANGEEIEYKVEEVLDTGDNAVITGTDGPGTYKVEITGDHKTGFTIKNIHTPETTESTVLKVWEDANDQDGIRPKTLEVTLKGNGEEVTLDGNKVVKTLNDANEWTETVTGLPKYANGEEIEYTWEEPTIDGYSPEDVIVDGNKITLTNTHVPDTTESTVLKVWVDNNNQDGIRPKTLEVTLKGNGEEVTLNGEKVVKTLSESNDWTETVTGLPKNANGKAIEYTWEEASIDGYTQEDPIVDGNKITLTNVHTPDTTESTVLKVWDDANNQDGIRPKTLEVTLKGNGEDVTLDGEKVVKTLSESNKWTVTVEGLPKNANGKAIEYTWEEASIDGYTQEDPIVDGNKITLTNVHKPDTTESTVTKVWEDEDNQDGKRPTSLTVTLLGNGEEVEMDGVTVTKELNEANDWTASVTGLPKNANGKAIEYTWSEPEITDYTEGEPIVAGNSYIITNTHTPELIDVDATKVWDDNENQDGIRPEQVTFKLTNTGKTITLDGNKDSVEEGQSGELAPWVATFKNLPKYANGEEIEYKVEEVLDTGDKAVITGTDGPGTYRAEIAGDHKTGFTITNIHTPETTNTTVLKVWDDNENQDGIRPKTLEVTLKGNGEEVTLDGNKVVRTLNDANKWTETVDGLPKYVNGKEIEYTWEEASIDGYTAQTPKIEGNKVTLTNVHTPDTTESTVLKVWDDADNQDGIRPKTLEVTLKGNGEDVTLNGEKVVKTLSESNKWTVTVEGLPKNANGKAIEYTWEEARIDGYTQEDPIVDGNKITLTNVHKPDTTESTVLKVWEDADNQDGIRPETLEVTLKGNGEDVTLNGEKVVKTLSESNKWTVTVEGLPKNANGKAIEYTWEEASVDGYTQEDPIVDGNKITLTNTHIPEVTSSSVEKVWDDANNQDGIRPEELVVTLKGNDEDVMLDGNKVVRTLNDTNSWKATVEGLPKKANGQVIKYTWEEVSVDGYDLTSATADLPDGSTKIILTNKHTPDTTESTVLKVWEDSDNQDGIRPETLEVTLKGNGEEVTLNGEKVVKTLSESNNWTETVTGLPKNANGKAIEYTWSEPTIDGYNAEAPIVEGNKVTLTNVHTPDTTESTVLKVWDDANNQDGIRPKTLEVTLKGNGEDVTLDGNKVVRTLSESNKWTVTVEGLPKNANGKAINYTWEEASIDGYTQEDPIVDGNKITLTNKHVPEVTSVAVKKVWEDDNDRDGIRPDELVVTLSDGKTVKLNEGNNWNARIDNLPKYADGELIEYTWTEDATPGYDLVEPVEVSTLDDETTLTTLTNTHTPDKTSIDVKKVWKDEDDQDGLRTAIEVELFKTIAGATSSTGKKATLDESNGWSASFTDLFKNDNGELILYSVKENTKLTDYETSYDNNNTNSGLITVTNNHTPYTTSVTVKKVWVDENNQDGKRKDVTVNLMKTVDGTTSKVESKTISLKGDGTTTFTDLPVNEGGSAITYSVTEETIDGYELTGNDVVKQEDGTWLITLTNKHEPELIDIPVEKKWDNSKNKFGFDEPTKIKVSLKDGNKVLEETTLDANNEWKYEFSDYPKYRDGQEIAYMVEEEYLADYKTEIEGSASEGFTITNTYNVELINVAINKVWDDKSDQDGLRPTEISAKLIGRVAEDIKYSKDITISGTKDVDTWSYEERDLPKTYYGEEITYTVEEVTVNGYEAPQYTGDFTTTLIITNPYTPQTVSYKVHKVWEDDDNHDGKRPESITVILKADGSEVQRQVLNDENGWSYEFLGLPKCKNHGQVISYSIEEVSVSDYESNISVNDEGTEAIITNTHENERMDITITKTWVDNNNALNLRPENIVVNVFANGELYKTVTLSNTNNWAVTLTVDKYIAGKEAVYTISEVSVPEYITTIDGFNITNTLNHTEIVPPNTLVEVTDSKDGLMSMIVVLGTLGMTILSIRKRYE